MRPSGTGTVGAATALAPAAPLYPGVAPAAAPAAPPNAAGAPDALPAPPAGWLPPEWGGGGGPPAQAATNRVPSARATRRRMGTSRRVGLPAGAAVAPPADDSRYGVGRGARAAARSVARSIARGRR